MADQCRSVSVESKCNSCDLDRYNARIAGEEFDMKDCPRRPWWKRMIISITMIAVIGMFMIVVTTFQPQWATYIRHGLVVAVFCGLVYCISETLL